MFLLLQPDRLGSLSPPVAWVPMSRDSVTLELATCLLAQAQSLWLVLTNDVYQAFAYANHTINPSPASCAIQKCISPRGSMPA
jgi:hypothetical protein